MALYPQDTIAAISTPLGEGGIGIIRLSGPDALAVTQRIFRGSTNGGFTSHRFLFGTIVDPVTDELVDEVLVVAMLAPRSYTCEDVVEVQCHGGFLMVQRILQLVLAQGARLAEPGEFTRRAFLNGRIDLVQAEAVIDVIRAKTDAALALAQRQRDGHLSQALYAIRDDLRHALALVEAFIDFPEDDLDAASVAELTMKIAGATVAVGRLVDGALSGRVLREGVTVALVGRPNVGKSSLLNALLREKRAIVTSVPGTTRDIIEEVVNIGGLPVRLQDTAGIRESEDIVEQEGVRRTLATIPESDLVLFLVDGSSPISADDQLILTAIGAARCLLVITKSDLPRRLVLPSTMGELQQVEVSVARDDGLERLRHLIHDAFLSGWAEDGREQLALSHVRQRDALSRCAEALQRAAAGVDLSVELELVAADLRDALAHLGEVTGETTPDDVLDLIFSRFCIGK
jgi:tRNA modification GTPase